MDQNTNRKIQIVWLFSIQCRFTIILSYQYCHSRLINLISNDISFFVDKCQEGDWFNTDNNILDRGDHERIETIIQQSQITRKKTCKFPEKIKVRRVLTPLEDQTLSENDPLRDIWEINSQNLQQHTFTKDNQKVFGNTIDGFKCEHVDQSGDGKCKDFEVQLCCPGKM